MEVTSISNRTKSEQKKIKNTILLLYDFISLSLVTLVRLQPNIGHQLRAQSVRSLQDRKSHRNQVRSLVTVLHFTRPFCPLWSLSINTKVTTWQNLIRDSCVTNLRHHTQPVLQSCIHQSCVVHKHRASQSCICTLSNERIWKSTPDLKYILSAVSHHTFHCINRVSCDRQLQENKSSPTFYPRFASQTQDGWRHPAQVLHGRLSLDDKTPMTHTHSARTPTKNETHTLHNDDTLPTQLVNKS